MITRLFAAAVVFWLALDEGTFGLVSRTSLAIVVWWAIGLAVVLGLAPLARLRATALATGGLLAAFAAWTGASVLWAESAERAVNEFNRTTLYLGIFAACALVARADTARRWCDGAALGITAIGGLALAQRFFGDALFDDPAERYFTGPQLRYPLQYSNGLGIFLGLAFPLLLRAAIGARSPWSRALAVAPLPGLAAALYLTSSRGGVGVALVGSLVFVALTTRRWAAAGTLAVASAGSAAAVAVVALRPELVDHPGTADAESQGRSAAAWLLLVCAATAVTYFLGERALLRRPTPSTAVGWATVVAVAVIAVAGVAAADPVDRFETFRQPPDPASSEEYTVRGHLASVSSTGRWQFWQAAIDQFEKAPVVGDGAGSYEAWWARHGSIALFITDAHSLYLETVGELGVVGLALLLATFGAGLAAALLALQRLDGHSRPTAAALAACFVAYAVGAGIDWMWELTVVSIVGFACLGFLVQSPAWVDHDPRRAGALPLFARAAAASTAVVLVFLQGSSLLSATRIRESEAAVENGDARAALDAADDARALQPWGSSPHLQLALVQEERGRLGLARSEITRAIERDGADWRLWLVRARIETEAGRISAARRSLARAAALNPRSPLFANVR